MDRPPGNPATLDELGILTGANKSSLLADYLRHYEHFLSSYRNQKMNLIEIGVASGASLQMWQQFFPNANIIGIDIREECRRVTGNRIKIYIGSQIAPKLLDQIAADHPPTIIVDDGSHIADHVIITFEHLFPRLLPGGCYLIEDLYVHVGPTAADWRGQADTTPHEYLQRYLASLMGNIFRGEHSRKDDIQDQIDCIGFVAGAAIVQKRSAINVSQKLKRLEHSVRLSGFHGNWNMFANLILREHGPIDVAEYFARKAVDAQPNAPHYLATLDYILKRKAAEKGAAELDE